MKLLRPLLFFVYFFLTVSANYAQEAQAYYKLINEAELAIAKSDLKLASEIYEKAFQVNGKALAQDYFNAAVCELQVAGFEASKKHLNKLAIKGVSLDWLENTAAFSELENSSDWASYRTFYQMLGEDNKSSFEEISTFQNFETRLDSVNSFAEESSTALNFNYNPYNAIAIEYDGVSYTVDTLQFKTAKARNDRFYVMLDSLFQLKKVQFLKSSYLMAFNNLRSDILNYLTENSWPEEHISEYALSKHNTGAFRKVIDQLFFNQHAGTPSFKTNSQTRWLYRPDIYFMAMSKADTLNIQKILTTAINEQKIKPETAFRLLYPQDFGRSNLETVVQVKIEEEVDCKNYNYQYFRHVRNISNEEVNFEKYQNIFNLPNQRDFSEKYVFVQTNSELFSFIFDKKTELLVLPSCFSLVQFMKNSVMVE